MFSVGKTLKTLVGLRMSGKSPSKGVIENCVSRDKRASLALPVGIWEIWKFDVPGDIIAVVVRLRQGRIWHGRIDVAAIAIMWGKVWLRDVAVVSVRWRRGKVGLREVLG